MTLCSVGDEDVCGGSNRLHRLLDSTTNPDSVQSVQGRTKTGTAHALLLVLFGKVEYISYMIPVNAHSKIVVFFVLLNVHTVDTGARNNSVHWNM